MQVYTSCKPTFVLQSGYTNSTTELKLFHFHIFLTFFAPKSVGPTQKLRRQYSSFAVRISHSLFSCLSHTFLRETVHSQFLSILTLVGFPFSVPSFPFFFFFFLFFLDVCFSAGSVELGFSSFTFCSAISVGVSSS